MNVLPLTTNVTKEVWEYKKALVWLPCIIAALMAVSPVIGIMLSDIETNWMIRAQRISEVQHAEHLSKMAIAMLSGTFVPFMIIAMFVQLHYFSTCLYDERKDMSILFWRSLPVSDAASIGVKLLVGALIIPTMFMLAATALVILAGLVFFVFCLIFSLGYDVSMWGVFLSGNWISNLLFTWANIIPFTLWMLPLFAWLMLASMYANKAPLLWAILPVVVVLLVESFLVSYFGFEDRFFAQLIMEYFSLAKHTIETQVIKPDGVAILPFRIMMEKVSIVALLVSAGLLYATYWLRANRSH